MRRLLANQSRPVQRAARALLALALFSGAALPLHSCAQSVGDIDRTQPDLVSKDAFTGQWFIRQSVTDVPATSAASFIGEMHDLEVVTWEIQEDYLVGYRAYEKVPGSEAQAEDNSGVNAQEVTEGLGEGRNKDVFKGNPVVAYQITDHVDVQREYNASTGEQTNVITENSADRPWQERSFMRVDWSENVVDNLFHKNFWGAEFMFGDSNRKEFIPESEGGPDAFKMDTDEEGSVNYIDFTERYFVAANEMGCLSAYVANGIGDCTDDEIKVRTSMLKVDVAREQDYEPVFYDDRRHGEFGYFRTERPSYDRGRGNTFSGLRQFANRHEIWANNRDKNGDLKPYSERRLRAVTYTLSPGYPSELIPVTEEMVAEYDAVLKRVAAAAREQDEEDLIKDLKKHTGGSCLFCLDTNDEGEARIGDLRYNFIYWVEDPQQVGPLGYGPSSAHPETGRIVSAAAYVYGAGVDRFATMAKDMVDAINGKLEQEDLIGFGYIKQAVRDGLQGVGDRAAEKLALVPLDEAATQLLGEKSVKQLARFKELGPAAVLSEHAPGFAENQLRRLQGTEFESLMIPAEMEKHFDPAGFFPQQLGDKLTFIQDTNVPSVVHWGTRENLEQLNRLNDFAARHNLWLEEFSDPAIVGLAREKSKQDLSDKELLFSLKKDIYRGVMLHEIGHTVGLRHNFGGSGDPLNYHDEYWEHREQTLPAQMVGSGEDANAIMPYLRSNCSRIDSVNEAQCKAQEDARMAEYQYSSIMDYGSRFNSDFHGLGYYDRAALASAYADLVEVFDDSVSDAMPANVRELVQFANIHLSPVHGLGQGLTNAADVHYTRLPELLGGVQNLGKRKWIPRKDWDNSAATGPVKVPYMSCYDEYVDAEYSCHRWDHGADNYEITADYIQRYKENYIFNNFQRDRIGFSGFSVLFQVADRFLMPLTNMYQHWLFDTFQRNQNTPQAVLGTIATEEGFNTLWNVLATPNYGGYVLQDGEYQQTTYDYNTADQVDLRIEPGVGRRPYSRFDFNSGYGVYDRVLESGHFYDQVAAIIALTSNDASVVGIGSDVQADALRYSIPYYLRYSDQLNQLFGSLFRGDSASYGPRLVNGKLVQRNVFNSLNFTQTEMDASQVVRVSPTFTTRMQAIVNAAAAFKSNFDTEFLYRMQIRMKGSGEDRAIPDDFEVVEAYNPQTGAVYVAYRPQDPARIAEGWLGAELLSTLAEMVTAWEEETDEGTKAQLLAEIRYQATDIEIVRGVYDLYSNAAD